MLSGAVIRVGAEPVWPTVSGVGIAFNQSLSIIQQRASHRALSQDVSRSRAPSVRSWRGRLDAIVVPASRPAHSLKSAINLAASLQVLLVVLCSKQTKVEHVAKRVSKTPGARSLIVRVPEGWSHPEVPNRTSARAFQRASANRASGLSAKRNLGLLLARLHGWNKIAFIDDDILLKCTDSIGRLAGQLDEHQVAGMIVRQHPDNSVVCHARRLAGFTQDVFMTGAVLGVHCNNLPLSFFPDIYNEDWFFFSKEAAARKLACVGEARQIEYDPFESPDRARREEFGDLLAEGLYALIGESDPQVPFDDQVRPATSAVYWTRCIEARRKTLAETRTRLHGFLDRDADIGGISSALESLCAAEIQLAAITADLCVSFLDAWRNDLDEWQRFSNCVNNVGSTPEAMEFLQLEKRWAWAEFGAAMAAPQTVTSSPHASIRHPIATVSRRSNRPNAGRNWRSPVASKPMAS
jgi:hypothetical protein